MGREEGSGEQNGPEERSHRGLRRGGVSVSFGRSGAVGGMKLVKDEAGHVIRDQRLRDLMCLTEEGRLPPEGIGEF